MWKGLARSARVRAGLALVLPALAAVALNAPSVTDTFQGDDFSFVVRHRQDGPAFFFQAFRELHIDTYYRPAADLSFFLQQKAFDADPRGWHAVGLALHAGAALALALAVLALTRRPLAAWLAGVLFALSPAYAGGVPWIANQTELLAGFGAALALALFVLATRDRLRPALLLGAVAAYGVALGAKEIGLAVLAPIALYAALQAGDRGWRPLRPAAARLVRAAVPLAPFLAVTAAWSAAQLYVRLVLQPPLLPYYHPGPHVVDTVRYYALRLVLPADASSTGWDALAPGPWGLDSPLGYLSAAAVFGLCLLALVRGTTPMRALAVWLLAALAPISLWEPFFTSARYTYTPALAFSGLVAAGAVPLAERFVRSRAAVAGVMVTLVAVLAVPCYVGTVRQNQETIDVGERETALLRQLEALELDVPEGATIYLVDTPWNGTFSPAESVAQMLYGPSVRVQQATTAQVASAWPAGDGSLVLGMEDGRLAVLRPDAPGTSPPAGESGATR